MLFFIYEEQKYEERVYSSYSCRPERNARPTRLPVAKRTSVCMALCQCVLRWKPSWLGSLWCDSMDVSHVAVLASKRSLAVSYQSHWERHGTAAGESRRLIWWIQREADLKVHFWFRAQSAVHIMVLLFFKWIHTRMNPYQVPAAFYLVEQRFYLAVKRWTSTSWYELHVRFAMWRFMSGWRPGGMSPMMHFQRDCYSFAAFTGCIATLRIQSFPGKISPDSYAVCVAELPGESSDRDGQAFAPNKTLVTRLA